ncbi:c-type cytochrome [Arsenicitalea aurantiaca]|nr:c-type cytochrome [Arsenicitalea aurantiaca]
MGAEVFARCAICHEIGPGAGNRQGPQLNELLGRRAGDLPDFSYSEALREAGQNGLVWTAETLAEFIARPRHFEPGSRMIFRGLRNPAEVEDVVAYLVSLETPDQVASRTGKALVETYCGACHATGSEDLGPHAEAPAFRDLHHRYDVGDLAEALVEGLSSGHPDMPEFEFDPDQAEAVIAYLKSLE